MLIAVPSDAPGGLDARISEHFGHSDVFTVVQVDGDQVGTVTLIPNQSHEQGGCMAPVLLLKQNGVDALVAGGMGMRPLSGFQEQGIAVHFREDATTVREAIDLMLAGKCREFGAQHTCGGHDGHAGCGGHHHHGPDPDDYEAVDGPAQSGRMVRISYELFDDGGKLVDSAEDIHYLHGQDQIVPGLELALEGHVAGDRFEVTLAPQQCYGERDESQVVEVPLERLPPDLSPGDTLRAQAPDGRVMPLTVLGIDEQVARLDTNHPLAGKTILFKLKVLEVLGERSK